MKTHSMSRLISCLRVLACVVVVLSVAAGGAAKAQKRESRLTHRQLLDLVANARTARDHEGLAEYFRREARRLQSQAGRYEQLARAHGDNTNLDDPNYFNIGRTARHCHNIAKESCDQARDAMAQAAIHEQMARQVKK